MNPKITVSALEKMQGKNPEELVSLTIRITTPLTTETISLLTAWGGKLLYDNGIMAVLSVPVGKMNDIAEWDCVIEVR